MQRPMMTREAALAHFAGRISRSPAPVAHQAPASGDASAELGHLRRENARLLQEKAIRDGQIRAEDALRALGAKGLVGLAKVAHILNASQARIEFIDAYVVGYQSNGTFLLSDGRTVSKAELRAMLDHVG